MVARAALKLNVKQAVPFFGISSMERSLPFYMDGLGFKMTNSWVVKGKIRWCWLELDEVAFMLQEHRGKEPNSWELLGKVGDGGNDLLSVRGCTGSLPQGEVSRNRDAETFRRQCDVGCEHRGPGWLLPELPKSD